MICGRFLLWVLKASRRRIQQCNAEIDAAPRKTACTKRAQWDTQMQYNICETFDRCFVLPVVYSNNHGCCDTRDYLYFMMLHLSILRACFESRRVNHGMRACNSYICVLHTVDKTVIFNSTLVVVSDDQWHRIGRNDDINAYRRCAWVMPPDSLPVTRLIFRRESNKWQRMSCHETMNAQQSHELKYTHAYSYERVYIHDPKYFQTW